jgi:hypothetical protein
LAAKREIAFKNVYELREFMGMKRKSCAGLKPNDLHLQAVGHGHVLDKHPCSECRWFPRQIIATYT